MRNISMIVAAAVVSFAAVAPAFAAATEAPVQTVSYADLNLAHKADLAKLKRRVASTIEAACGSYQNTKPVEQDAIGRCRTDIDAALQPQLAALIASQQVRLAAR